MRWYSIIIIFVGTILNSVLIEVKNKDLAFCLQSFFNAVTLFLIVRFVENTL